MLVRIITLCFSALFDGFDDSELIDFIGDKNVLALREHFFIKNEMPYLAVLVTYEPVADNGYRSSGRRRRKQRVKSGNRGSNLYP
jgi:hypothetical protein